MYRSILLTVLLGSCCLILVAQSSQDKADGFLYSAGYQNILIHDQLSSPLLYSAHALSLQFLYEKKKERFFETEIQLSVGTSQPSGIGRRSGSITDIPDFYGNAETFDVNLNPYLSLFQVQGNLRWGLQRGKHAFGLGTGIHHTLSAMRLDSWNYSQIDIRPFYAVQTSVGRGDVGVLFELPVLAWVVRPNYSSDAYIPGYTSYYLTYVLTESRVVSVGKLINPQLRLQYNRPLASGKTVGLGYKAAYLHYPNPQPLSMLSNQLFLQIQF